MKDTNNILSYNQWSCGDYKDNQPTDDDNFTLFDTTAYYSKEFSVNGESSVKVIKTGTTDPLIRVNYRSTFSTAKTITFNCKIYNPSAAVYIRLTNNTISSGVYVPKSDSILNVSVSLSAVSNNGIYVYFNFQNDGGSVFFFDDINLTMIQ